MKEPFLYYIHSRSALEGDDKANSCTIPLRGLPTTYKKFRCEVLNFMINASTLNNASGLLEFIGLTADTFVSHGYSTYKNGTADVVAEVYIADSMSFKRNQFVVDNFQYKEVKFELVDVYGFLIEDALINQTNDTVWTLSLLLHPIE